MLIPARSLLALAIFHLTCSVAVLAQAAPVRYSPYTAIEKTTFIQKLADGTTILREANVTMLRDSQGRTLRKETVQLAGGREMTHTVVADPVAKTFTTWTTQSKFAVRNHLLAAARFPNPLPAVAGSSNPASLSPGLGSGAGGSVGGSVNAINAAGPVLPGGIGVGLAGFFSDPNLKPTIKREKLEGKTIAGVYAEGIRMTTTYPVNSLGNDRPISMIRETWTSADLNINLYSVTDDPRSGMQITEVTSLDRSEPDVTLFDPPAGYEIKDTYPSNSSGPN